MQSRIRMAEASAEVGFELRYNNQARIHNTFYVHQLLHWADQQGRAHDLKQALFSVHFTEAPNWLFWLKDSAAYSGRRF